MRTILKFPVSCLLIIFLFLMPGCSSKDQANGRSNSMPDFESQDLNLTNSPEELIQTPTIESTEIIVETPTTEPTVEISYEHIENGPVTIFTNDGERLAGFVTLPDQESDKHVALILGHEHGSNYHSWDQVVEDLVGMGYTVLAFDFRGHGESSGSENFNTLKVDVDAVIKYLEYQGFDKIVCAGSSQGGTGCLASTLSTDSIIGLVLISAPMNIQERHIKRSYLETLNIPKLIIVAENDSAKVNTPDFVTAILKMYEWSAEPKSLYLAPGFFHGVALLNGDSGAEARDLFFDFLSSIIEN